MLIGSLTSLFAFMGSLTAAVSVAQAIELRHFHRPTPSSSVKKLSRHLRANSIDLSRIDSNYGESSSQHDNKFTQRYHSNYHPQVRTDIKFAQQTMKREANYLDSTYDNRLDLSSSEESPKSSSQNQSLPPTTNASNPPSTNYSTLTGNLSANSNTNYLTNPSTLPASTTLTPLAEYATVNYNGIIGINATDRYALSAESRTFGLPIKSQVLMCLLYGTLAFTAIASNMIVCYIVLSDQRMRTATNYFIVNLAVGDILMALLCIPFTFIANLIYQYWPFGLSLCVIVSYAQANTVFISAYTMVAISIDKYLAIMYPMRLRMLKRQAKILILVIWTAALLTSLPTALLSSLSPASMESFSTTNSTETVTSQPLLATTTTTISSSISSILRGGEQAQQISLNGSTNDWSQQSSPLVITTNGESISSSDHLNLTDLQQAQHPNKPHNNQQQQQQQPQQEQQRKYFCQESWAFWPRGRYYYSTALMILQYVLPLFVLVITYSRIVIVVWGKRIPGEEDNARDARMARSKRKMIKMVIFCVIAFALTWLPFNALIVIGDINPEIWENQNIMYIWFITHFLAMCHTITNPLIYIWMNNRFRAGFKQVFWDLYLPIKRSLAYLWFWFCCFGCLLSCSRRKYSRVSSSLKRKQKLNPMASSGSNNTGIAAAATAAAAAASSHPQSGTAATSHGAGGHVSNCTKSVGIQSTTEAATANDHHQRQLGDSRVRNANFNLTNAPNLDKATSGPVSNQQQQQFPSPTVNNQNNVTDDNNNKTQVKFNGDDDNERKFSTQTNKMIARASSWTPGSARQLADGLRIPIKQIKMFAKRKRGAAQRLEVELKQTQAQTQQDQDRSNSKSRNHQTDKIDSANNKAEHEQRKRRKKQSHKINIQMTTTEYRNTCKLMTSNCSSSNQQVVPANMADKPPSTNSIKHNHQKKQQREQQKEPSSSWWRKNNGGSCSKSQCFTCRQEKLLASAAAAAAAAANSNSQTGASDKGQTSSSSKGASRSQMNNDNDDNNNVRKSKRRERSKSKADEFIMDMHQSSQSTATISLLTNTTSLALSPLNSQRGANNSTSASSNASTSAAAAAAATAVAAAENSTRQSAANSEQMVALDQQEVVLPATVSTVAPTNGCGDIKRNKSQESPPSKAPSSIRSGFGPEESIVRYMDETESSSNRQLSSTSQEEEFALTNGCDIELNCLAGGGTGKTGNCSQLTSSNSLLHNNSSALAQTTKQLQQTGTGSSTSTDHEEELQFCEEHRQQQQQQQQLRADSDAEEENLETDDDICDVVFQQQGAQKCIKPHAVRCNGSLEMLSDHFDDDDDDDDDDEDNSNGFQGEEEEDFEEVESLEAEFGDEHSPLRCSFAMVKLNSTTAKGATENSHQNPSTLSSSSSSSSPSRNNSSAFASSRQTRLLGPHKTFRSAGDDLYIVRNPSPPETKATSMPADKLQAETRSSSSSSSSKQQASTLDNSTAEFEDGCFLETGESKIIPNQSLKRSNGDGDDDDVRNELENNNDDRLRFNAMSSGNVNSNLNSTSMAKSSAINGTEVKASSELIFASSSNNIEQQQQQPTTNTTTITRERSLRRSMLLNNHLLSSLGRIPNQSSSNSYSIYCEQSPSTALTMAHRTTVDNTMGKRRQKERDDRRRPVAGNQNEAIEHRLVDATSASMGRLLAEVTDRRDDELLVSSSSKFHEGAKSEQLPTTISHYYDADDDPKMICESLNNLQTLRSQQGSDTTTSSKCNGSSQASGGGQTTRSTNRMNGFDKIVNCGGDEAKGKSSDNQSSSAPASITKNTSSRPLESEEEEEAGVINKLEEGHQRQQVVGSNNNSCADPQPPPPVGSRGKGTGKGGAAYKEQHHSLTSLNSSLRQHHYSASSKTGPSSLDCFKSLDQDSLDGGNFQLPQDDTLAAKEGEVQMCGVVEVTKKKQPLVAASNGLSRRQAEGGGGDLIDRLSCSGGELAASKFSSPSSREQVVLLGGKQLRGEQYSWTKSASTLVVRKSPTVYLISKSSKGDVDG